MKFTNCCAARIALALTISSAAAWAQPPVMKIGGNPIVERDYPDASTFLYILDTNHPFTSNGPVNQWEIYADTTNPVQLIIYRQTGGVFVEVGRSNVVTPKPGYNLFELTQPIVVQAGDFVGAYQPSQGPITYTDYSFTCFYGNLGHTTLQTTGASPTGFNYSCDRTYSLRAF
ncbi:MAG TPA: hypothetical protein VGM27_03075 [Acidobacteriaceae bacterium]|jgi:hypothetical protein